MKKPGKKSKLPPALKSKARRYAAAAAVMLVSVSVSALLLFQFSRFMQEQVFNERRIHLEEITDKTAQMVDTVIESAWEHTDVLGRMMADSAPDTPEDTISLLSKLNEYIPLDDTVMMAVTADGHYYSSDGVSGLWGRVFHKFNEFAEHSVTMTYADGRGSMVFVMKMPEPITTENGETLTHIALSRSIDAMQREFHLPETSGQSTTCIVDSDGNMIFSQDNFPVRSSEWNIIEAMERRDIIRGDSADDIAAALSGGKDASLEFGYVDGSYFAACSPLSYNGWSLALFVPDNVLSTGNEEITITAIVFASIISALAIISVTLAVFLLMNYVGARKYNRTQEALNRQLSEEAKKAENASEQKARYYSRVTHDIRTPISGIIGMADMAEKNAGDPSKVRYCLGKIRGCAGYLLSLINDVLDMRRIEKGEVKIPPEPMDLLELLDDCAAIIRGQLAGRKVEFRCDFSGVEHERVLGSALRLRQILINILGNSVNFTPDGGRITFTATESRGGSGAQRYIFTVADSGIGMSEEFQKIMFLPFAQEHESGRGRFAGTGLGMAITKQLVEIMGGEITVKSAPGEGTEISVALEMCVQPDIPQTNISANSVPAGMCVLIAEDSLVNMEILRFNLEQAGIRVIPAENGREAAELFAQSPVGSIEAVLMDVRMPVMNGLDSTRLIRSMDRPDSGRVRIIAMTANTYSEDIQQTLSAGMDECLSKPVDAPELLKLLGRIHAEAAAAAAEEIAGS